MNTREISQEEFFMQEYFKELQEAGFIKEIIYQPEPIILSEKVIVNKIIKLKTKEKVVEKTLINQHVYTPDFEIHFNGSNKLHKSINNIFYEEIPLMFSDSFISLIEVKSNSHFDNNMKRHFTSALQPWVYQRHNLFVNLIEVPKIFEKSFIPKSILPEFFYKVNTKKNKKNDPKFNWKYHTLNEYLNEKNF
jgi:hypothetical protein